MEAGRPSTTAERAARLRAAHQLLDHPPLIDDPILPHLLDPPSLEALRKNPASFDTPLLRALRAGIAVRSRYAEDCLADAAARGTRQYIVLGAGLDSFAYRNPIPSLRVFEVDHPETQRWKRRRLETAGIDPSAIFVPVDFERETLRDALGATTFDLAAPAFVSWLGVTVYLTRDAILRTFEAIASLAAGTEIVFDYLVPSASLGAPGRAAVAALAGRAAAVEEPWRTSFEPPEIAADLRRAGFRRIDDLSPDDIFARYFRGRADGLRAGSASHLIRAGT